MHYKFKAIELLFISQSDIEDVKTKMNQILRNLQKKLSAVHHSGRVMRETGDETLSEFKNMKRIYNKVESL